MVVGVGVGVIYSGIYGSVGPHRSTDPRPFPGLTTCFSTPSIYPSTHPTVQQGAQAILGSGLELTPKHCTMLISALGAVGLWRETVRALNEMKARGWTVNKVGGVLYRVVCVGRGGGVCMDGGRTDGRRPGIAIFMLDATESILLTIPGDLRGGGLGLRLRQGHGGGAARDGRDAGRRGDAGRGGVQQHGAWVCMDGGV